MGKQMLSQMHATAAAVLLIGAGALATGTRISSPCADPDAWDPTYLIESDKTCSEQWQEWSVAPFEDVSACTEVALYSMPWVFLTAHMVNNGCCNAAGATNPNVNVCPPPPPPFRGPMHEDLVTGFMPGSVAEMDAYFATLTAVVSGWETAKTATISAECTSSDGAAVWGTDAAAVANCIEHSTCNYDEYAERCQALAPIAGLSQDNKPCANCTDQNEAGCMCFRQWAGMTNMPRCEQPPGQPEGEVYDGCPVDWRPLTGDPNETPYNPSTDICTKNNRTDPNDPDGGELQRDAQCATTFGANSNDEERTIENPIIGYRLFAQAALNATTALPFVASMMAINAFNRCDNQTEDWEGYWDGCATPPCAPWPGAQCGSVTIGAAIEDYVLDGSVNEGSLVVQPAEHPDRRAGLIVNAINNDTGTISALSARLNVTGGVVAIYSAVNAGGQLSANDMIKATIFNATNQDGGVLTASGSAVMKSVTNEAGATLRFLSGSAAIMDASNAGTMSITELTSGFLANVQNLVGGVLNLQSAGPATVRLQGATNAGTLSATGVSVEGCNIANSGTMTISGAGSVTLALTANTGSIDFGGSSGTVTMVNGAARGTVTNDGGITWVDSGADCTLTAAPTTLAPAAGGAPTTLAPAAPTTLAPAGSPTVVTASMIYRVAVTFDVDFNELNDADKETLKTLAKTAFCTRITAAGVTCVAADLIVALSAGTASRVRTRQTGTTIATVTLPAGTTSAQATAITNDVINTPVTITDESGSTTTSTGASYTAAPVGGGTDDSAASTGAQAFPALVALAALGASMVL